MVNVRARNARVNSVRACPRARDLFKRYCVENGLRRRLRWRRLVCWPTARLRYWATAARDSGVRLPTLRLCTPRPASVHHPVTRPRSRVRASASGYRQFAGARHDPYGRFITAAAVGSSGIIIVVARYNTTLWYGIWKDTDRARTAVNHLIRAREITINTTTTPTNPLPTLSHNDRRIGCTAMLCGVFGGRVRLFPDSDFGCSFPDWNFFGNAN